MSRAIACIVADWGTTNLRVWAMAADGGAIERRVSDRGLLAVERGRFVETLEGACGDWLAGPEPSQKLDAELGHVSITSAWVC